MISRGGWEERGKDWRGKRGKDEQRQVGEMERREGLERKEGE